jgi:ArsR family transcriptional regulator
MDSLYEVKARIVRLLAHPKRLEIVDVLRHGERTVTEISDAIGLSQAGTSQQLALLRRGAIVEIRKQGNFTFYRLSDPTIGAACRMMNDAVIAVLSREAKIARPILAAARGRRWPRWTGF